MHKQDKATLYYNRFYLNLKEGYISVSQLIKHLAISGTTVRRILKNYRPFIDFYQRGKFTYVLEVESEKILLIYNLQKLGISHADIVQILIGDKITDASKKDAIPV